MMDSKVASKLGAMVASVLATVMVVVLMELAFFTIQIGKSSAVSSVANTHGFSEFRITVRYWISRYIGSQDNQELPLETYGHRICGEYSQTWLFLDIQDRGNIANGERYVHHKLAKIPKSTVHDILHKRLKLRAYKLPLLHCIQLNDRRLTQNFVTEILQRIDENPSYLDEVIFSDDATFHKVNHHNCCLWGSENPHAVVEYQRDTEKVNVWMGLMHKAIIGSFFFLEKTVTGHSYLDMLENFAVSQISLELTFQQDSAPPHYHQFPSKKFVSLLDWKSQTQSMAIKVS
ncbi:hypothetical protein ANN_24731 [Periplaneta americana]|uniref:Uncharacterized protein n=1 Tax=Periplaneta americana TaxID=6978 RepID=A0ABQ8RZR2_PERAM|nr:hypothetical protein ANN_24731 [Periplaneta americana]